MALGDSEATRRTCYGRVLWGRERAVQDPLCSPTDANDTYGAARSKTTFDQLVRLAHIVSELSQDRYPWAVLPGGDSPAVVDRCRLPTAHTEASNGSISPDYSRAEGPSYVG